MLLFSISSVIAGFVSIPLEFNLVIPIILLLVSGFGILSGFVLLLSPHQSQKNIVFLSAFYILFPPIGAVLGMYTLYRFSGLFARLLRTVLVQFAIVAAVFWFFHWIYPDIDAYIKQNPKTHNTGIAPQIGREYVAPLYSTVDVKFVIDSDNHIADHATMGLARAKQGIKNVAVREFQSAIEILRGGAVGKRFNTWLILPIIAMLVYFIISKAILKSGENIPASILLSTVIALKIGIDVSVAMINGGFFAVGAPIGNNLEYYSDVPKVGGIWSFLGRFTETDLSLHTETHPPGGAIFLWIASKLFDYDLVTASFAIIVFGALILIPIYLLAKQLYGEKVGRYALILCLATPNLILFSATCMDIVFSTFMVWSIYLYFHSLRTRSVFYGVLTGASIAASMLMNFTTTTLGIYFIVLAIIAYLRNRPLSSQDTFLDVKLHLKMLLISGGVFMLIYILLYLGPRYSIVDNLRVATARDRGMMGTGYETFERYIFLSIANPMAYFIFVGFPSITLWLREVMKTIQEAFRRVHFDSFLIAYIVTFVIIIFSTLYTLEVERIWMFMSPFILIPAGKHLAAYIEARGSFQLFYITAALLWFQIFAFEILLNTRW